MANYQPNLNREMFYDRFIRNMQRELRSGRPPRRRLNEFVQVFTQEAKLFYIDDFIKESLLNSHFNFADNDPQLAKLPFQNMFFELETGLEYRNLEDKINDEFYINGLLFTPLRADLARESIGEVIKPEEWNSRGFSVYTFGNLKRNAFATGAIHEAHFFYDTKNLLINELISSIYNEGRSEIHSLVMNLGDPEKKEEFKRKLPPGKDLSEKQFIEDEYLDAQKLPNLVINLIDYIRAENVVITPQRRILKGPGKNQTTELRPYHLVEVKKRIYPKREDAQEGLWEIDCRFWVMGHNHKYHTNNGIITNWIDPFIKGPENAPWKNNRYLMLYKNFRHRLDRRGNEDIGTSLQ